MWPFLYVGLCEVNCLVFNEVIARSNTHIVYLVDPVLHFLKIHPHTFPQRGVLGAGQASYITVSETGKDPKFLTLVYVAHGVYTYTSTYMY